jgi:hypothetical protein
VFARAALAAWLAEPDLGPGTLRLGCRWDPRVGPVPVAGLSVRGASLWFEATPTGPRIEVVSGKPGPMVWPWVPPVCGVPAAPEGPAATATIATEPPPVGPKPATSPSMPPVAPSPQTQPSREEGWLDLDDLGS